MQALDNIEHNLRSLLARYKELQQEAERLRAANDSQRQEIMNTHAELVTLRQQYRHLQTAMSMLGDEQKRQKAKQEINYIISLVDRTLQTLNG